MKIVVFDNTFLTVLIFTLLSGKSNSDTDGGTFVQTVQVSAPTPLPPVLG